MKGRRRASSTCLLSFQGCSFISRVEPSFSLHFFLLPCSTCFNTFYGSLSRVAARDFDGLTASQAWMQSWYCSETVWRKARFVLSSLTRIYLSGWMSFHGSGFEGTRTYNVDSATSSNCSFDGLQMTNRWLGSLSPEACSSSSSLTTCIVSEGLPAPACRR